MEVFEAYIPMDRRQAMARHLSLPDKTFGSALFADISGFTPLTEALTRTLGARRGAEELTIHLNAVYQALIQEVDRYRGSVIAFAGDAITCWFDADNGWNATTCALAMQGTMAQFSRVELANGEVVSLAVKVGIASGSARRFLVGDPEVQVLDVLAGRTLGRMAAAAHVASRGEVILAPEVAAELGDGLQTSAWKVDEASVRFAVVGGCKGAAILSPWPSLPGLNEASLRPWLIRPVFERVSGGHGEFLTELRPAVAVFLKFEGINYDDDEAAGEKLSNYVSWVQEVVGRYEGFLIDVAIGDKGSYLYNCFGAPTAHENDVWRAMTVATELVRPPEQLSFVSHTQIGISSGTMRTGAYGSLSRRTYGVLGDDVNLAARLMEQAGHGQVLVSGRSHRSVREAFQWETRTPLKLKGKAEPVHVFRLLGPKTQAGCGLVEPAYALPMVGRQVELARIDEKIRAVLQGQGQVLRISAEAGMGKSRLVAEALRLANQTELSSYGGQCQSFGANTSYLVWWSIWRGLFGLDASQAPAEQALALEARLNDIDPLLAPRLPLLGTVLNLPLQDNELTAHMDAKLRKAALQTLLIECLRRQAARKPLVLVLEDCHWIDPLSQELMQVLARAMTHLPVLLILTQRPLEPGQAETQLIDQLPYFTQLLLASFTNEEAERLLQLKVSHLFGSHAQPLGGLG
jgi:class 3 adenylate cyclase